MAEHLRLLGDLTPSELSGPMEAFLAELRQAGRALVIELPGTSEPLRWISAEEQSLYRRGVLRCVAAPTTRRERRLCGGSCKLMP